MKGVGQVTDKETRRQGERGPTAHPPSRVARQGAKEGGQGAEAFARLELHIGELVLQGFPAMDVELLGAAVQAELTRLLSASGLPSRLAQAGPAATLDGGQFSPEVGEDVQSLGARIARAVYAGLEER